MPPIEPNASGKARSLWGGRCLPGPPKEAASDRTRNLVVEFFKPVSQGSANDPKTMRKILFTTFVILCSLVSVAQAEISPDKRKEVEKMLELTGMEKLMSQVKRQMLTAIQKQQPNLGKEFWDKLDKKMDMQELVEKIIPVYDKYYTLEDLKAVNAFYESAAGKKVLATLPQVMQESMKIGQEWGESIGKQAAAEAEAEAKKK